MKNPLNQVIPALLVFCFVLQPVAEASQPQDIRDQARKANQTALTSIQEMEKAGTEFFLDASKKKQVNPRDLFIHRNGAMKVYVLAPFDRELNTRVGFAQTFKSTDDGKLKLTIEVLRNSSHKMTSYPVRALKTVTLFGDNADQMKIETTRAIQAAMQIAKNQMDLSMKKASLLNRFANSALNLFLPSAQAGIISFTSNIIMAAAGVILIRTAFRMFEYEAKGCNGCVFDPDFVKNVIGVVLMVMGFKLAVTGIKGLTGDKK